MENYLKEAFSNIGININCDQIRAFSQYSLMLREWNERINLTAITDEKEIIIKHFIDSCSVLEHINISEGASLIDVGTGAGFPGLPVKIIRNDIKLTLLDSLNKRIGFLEAVRDNLKLKDVLCIHGRAEEVSHKSEYREKFDYSLSRAVANLSILSEFCLPYIKVGGYFGALKGPNAYKEVMESKDIVRALGGDILYVKEINIPNINLNHTLIIMEKVRKSPESFPRRMSVINKNKK